jgi:hypothetical protein
MFEKIRDRQEAALKLAEIINRKLDGRIFQDEEETFFKEFSEIMEIGDEFSKNCDGMEILYARSIENGHSDCNAYYVIFSDGVSNSMSFNYSTKVCFKVLTSNPTKNGWFWTTQTRFHETSICKS